MSEGIPINKAAKALGKSESGCHCKEIQETLDIILSEIRELRREKLPADPEKIEDLLAGFWKR